MGIPSWFLSHGLLLRSSGVSVYALSIWAVWFPTEIVKYPLSPLNSLEGFGSQSTRYPLPLVGYLTVSPLSR